MTPNLDCFAKAPAALKHLHKVTGKWGLENIAPMDEKRWSDKCWDSYHVLRDCQCVMDYGVNAEEVYQKIAESISYDDTWLKMKPQK